MARTRLEQLAREANLGFKDFVKRFHVAALGLGEKIHISETQAKRWLSGTSGTPRPAAPSAGALVG